MNEKFAEETLKALRGMDKVASYDDNDYENDNDDNNDNGGNDDDDNDDNDE